jgi:hypothetical protein
MKFIINLFGWLTLIVIVLIIFSTGIFNPSTIDPSLNNYTKSIPKKNYTLPVIEKEIFDIKKLYYPVICNNIYSYGEFLSASKNDDQNLFNYLLEQKKCLVLNKETPSMKISVIDEGNYKNYRYCKIRMFNKNNNSTGYVRDSSAERNCSYWSNF